LKGQYSLEYCEMHVQLCYWLAPCCCLPFISFMKRYHKIHKKKDWFKIKGYSHIGLPMKVRNRDWVEKYVSDKSKVAVHGFLPFIHRATKVRKFRRETCHDGTRSELRKPGEKTRELYYASHLDSCIYGYYAEVISSHYEAKLTFHSISDCVTAYRKIRLDPANLLSRNKSNVDFANDVFSYIKNHSSKKLIAITFDIKSFFDTLNHKKLKQAWRFVINSGANLPSDHYNVYSNITKFSFVEERDLFNEFKDAIWVERNATRKTKKVSNRKFLRNQRSLAFCLEKDLELLRSKKYVKSNKREIDEYGNLKIRTKGIPQGSPISSLLANIYMFEFDCDANAFLTSRNGIYRRYSDDMVAICTPDYETEVIEFFEKKINEFDLEIQKQKTQVFHFIRKEANGKFECWEKNLNTGKLNNNTRFEYLGFQFDGFYTLLKSSSIASFYRKMKRSIKRGNFYSIFNKTNTKGELFKNRLYKRFTHLGAQRRRKYQRDKNNPSQFVVTEKYDWGNYLSYAYLAARIIPDNKIRRQVRNHWKKFHELIIRK
jgi:hypothetical protein